MDLPGYSKIIKSRRLKMKGGGVALFFNNDMQVSWKVRPDLSIRDSPRDGVFICSD